MLRRPRKNFMHPCRKDTTFRSDKLSLSARVLRVADGVVVASAVESSESVTNFATPEGMIKRVAKKLREAL